jgi:hypothetical protein
MEDKLWDGKGVEINGCGLYYKQNLLRGTEIRIKDILNMKLSD